MELETFDNVYMDHPSERYQGDHHWYGHVSDVAYDNDTFIKGFWVMMLILFGIPLMIAFPSLLILVMVIAFFIR